jgi:ERCC4-related helicase
LLNLDKESFSINKFDTVKYISDIKEDINLLNVLQKKAESLIDIDDIKIKEIIKIIEEYKDKKILIFSQYSDTTNYLINKIKDIFSDKEIEELS